MAHFYGSMTGSAKTEATRCGTKNSGISAHVRGWEVGVRLYGHAGTESDYFEVYATHGSSGNGASVYMGTVRIVDGQLIVVQS
jgi:hypothetical protein